MFGMIWVLLTPYGQNYLHLSESIGLEIVHIVSIKCVIRALGTGNWYLNLTWEYEYLLLNTRVGY